MVLGAFSGCGDAKYEIHDISDIHGMSSVVRVAANSASNKSWPSAPPKANSIAIVRTASVLIACGEHCDSRAEEAELFEIL